MLSKEEYETMLNTLAENFGVEVTEESAVYQGVGYWGIEPERPAIITASNPELTEDAEMVLLGADLILDYDTYKAVVTHDNIFVLYPEDKFVGLVTIKSD